MLCFLYQRGLIEIDYTEHQRAYTTTTTAKLASADIATGMVIMMTEMVVVEL